MNDLTQRVDRGFDVVIYDPSTGDDTDVVIRIEFGEGMRREIAEQKQRNLRNKLKPNRPGFRNASQLPERDYAPEQDERDLVALLAGGTISWTNIAIKDEGFPYTPENAVRLYTEFPWVRDQVHDAVRKNFSVEDALASPAFGKTTATSAQASRRTWTSWNRQFAAGNFELASLSRAEEFADAQMETNGHTLQLRDHRALPLWTGERVKNLAVIYSDGFGDALLFGRYLSALCSRVECVTAIVDAPLRTLFDKNTPPSVDVFDLANCAEGLKDADAHVSMFFLPNETGEGYGTAAWVTDESATRTAGPGAAARVGICWTGSTENMANQLRSIPVERLRPLLEVPGVEWHSLQADKRAAPPAGVIDHAHELRSFMDTANLISTLDLVISIDSAVANLAGSMGVPLWALVERPGESDFRWALSGDSTPWFPSARVFRQGNDRKWKRVMWRVAEALVVWKAEWDAETCNRSIAHAEAAGGRRHMIGRAPGEAEGLWVKRGGADGNPWRRRS